MVKPSRKRRQDDGDDDDSDDGRDSADDNHGDMQTKYKMRLRKPKGKTNRRTPP